MTSEKIYAAVGRITPVYDFLAASFGYKNSVNFFVSQLPFAELAPIEVLDAGCGTGLYSLAVLKRYPNSYVTAFDYEPSLVEFSKDMLKKHGASDRAELFAGDITNVSRQIDDHRFDLVITSGVLEYVPLADTVKNLVQYLNPGGYFLNSPLCDSPWGRFIGWLYACRPYSRQQNLEAFEQSGFALQNLITIPWYSPPSFKEAHIWRQD